MKEDVKVRVPDISETFAYTSVTAEGTHADNAIDNLAATLHEEKWKVWTPFGRVNVTLRYENIGGYEVWEAEVNVRRPVHDIRVTSEVV